MAIDYQFTADGPKFAKLRPDLRQKLREAETEFRVTMREMLDRFPAHLMGNCENMVTGVPSRFIEGLLPVLKELSETQDMVELIVMEVGRTGGRAGDRAS